MQFSGKTASHALARCSLRRSPHGARPLHAVFDEVCMTRPCAIQRLRQTGSRTFERCSSRERLLRTRSRDAVFEEDCIGRGRSQSLTNTSELFRCGVHRTGARGFEPPTSWSRTKRSTRLSHAPLLKLVNLRGNLIYKIIYTRFSRISQNAPSHYYPYRWRNVPETGPLVPNQISGLIELCRKRVDF
jgi:hypothetical protein